MSDNTDEPFEGEAEVNPFDKPYPYQQIKPYRRKQPKQRVYAFDGTDQSVGNLNDLLDKGWLIRQQLEPQGGCTTRTERSLYLLELEVE